MEFPDFWGWYHSLAGAYLKSGKKKLAIENYEKAAELNPTNKDIQKTLKRLREK